MVIYKPRDFKATMQAVAGPESTGIAPVSRYAHVYMGKIVDKIMGAQMQVGLPDEATIEKLKKAEIKTKEDLNRAYEGVEFIAGSRPLTVIEVCYEPKSPDTMRDFFQEACKYRDEINSALKVIIGTTQTRERFNYMIENGFLPDGVVSTNMVPLKDEYIREFCAEMGILLGPNVGFSSDNLVDCIESRILDQDGNVIAGAGIQKVFPFGSVNSLDYLAAAMATHPDAVLMPTGGVSNLTARALIRKGASLVGASAPAKKGAIINATYGEVVEKTKEAWDDFIRDASIMATEVYIGRRLRAEDEKKAKGADDELNGKFEEIVQALGR
ncbi:MAG: hypothetical protein U9O94_09515 [Nanoarchaeota archaeon]|nr:hypothetical protein [Nanoarchaeota archaeon]